jgi:hypothetical protein
LFHGSRSFPARVFPDFTVAGGSVRQPLAGAKMSCDYVFLPQTTEQPIVFISYSRRDGHDAAEWLEHALTARGVRTWRDTRDIDPFRDFTADIETHIDEASHVVVCVTEDSKRSDSFVRREIQYALLARKAVIPLRFADIPPHISIINCEWVDCFDARLEPLERLWQLIVGRTPDMSPAVSASDPFQPYVAALYRHTVTFLRQAVLSLVELHVDASRGITDNQRAAGRDMFPQFYFGQGLSPSNRAAEFASFHEAARAFGGRVLLLGAPGSGKTITLMAAARDAAAARLADANAALPLLGLIPTWDAAKRPPLATWLAAGLPFLTVASVEQVIHTGKALLLLDSLDELGDEYVKWRELATGEVVAEDRFDPRTRFIDQLPSRGEIVITCRVADFETLRSDLPVKGAVTLRPLTDAQIAEYLATEPELLEAVGRDGHLREMLRTPLLISLFAFAYSNMSDAEAAEARDLSRSSAELRDRVVVNFVRKCFDWEARKHALPVDYAVFISFCCRVAFEDAARSWGRNLLVASDNLSLYELATRVHVLIEHSDNFGLQTAPAGKRLYRFVHLLVRDYFAFREAIAARASTSVDDRTSALNGLNQMPDVRAPGVICRFLLDREPRVRYLAVGMLAHKRGDLDELLDEHMRSGSGDVREGVIDIIARRGGSLSAKLPELLGDHRANVRAAAARAIGRLRVTSGCAEVTKLLHDPDTVVRANAIYALGEIGDSSLTDKLLPLLTDDDPLIRHNAMSVMFRIGSEQGKAAARRATRS